MDPSVKPVTPRDAYWDEKFRLSLSSETKSHSVFVVFFLWRVRPRDELDTPTAHMTRDVWLNDRIRYSWLL